MIMFLPGLLAKLRSYDSKSQEAGIHTIFRFFFSLCKWMNDGMNDLMNDGMNDEMNDGMNNEMN